MDVLTKLLLSYLILVFAYSHTHGFFSLGSIFLVISSLLILLFTNVAEKTDIKQLYTKLKLVLVISVALSILYYGGLYQENKNFVLLNHLILLTCLPISFLYFYKSSKYFSVIFKYKFIYLFFIAILLRIFMIISSPNPIIDVYDQLKYGSLGLFELKNPYEMTFHKIYPNQQPASYGYLPGSAILLAPFSKFLGDPRYAFVLADLASGIMIFSLLKNRKKDKVSEIMSLIFLFNPMSLFVIEQSWLEPLPTVFFLAFAYLYFHKRKSLLPFIVFGLALTLKQNLYVAIPVFILKLNLKLKQLLTLIVVPVIIIMPFYLWSPKDFIADQTAGFNPAINSASRIVNFSLNISSLLNYISLPRLNFLQSFGAIIILSIYVLTRKGKGFKSFLLCFLTIMFTVTLFFFQAFLNYFTFLSSLILILLTFLLNIKTSNDL